MRTQFLLLCFLLSVFMMGGCQNETKEPAPTMAVFDFPRVLNESYQGKLAYTHMEKLYNSMQEALVAMQQQIQTNPEDTALQQKFQEKYTVIQSSINAEQQRIAKLLNDNVQKTLDAYRIQKKLTLILDAGTVLSYTSSADITDAIIAEFNKITIDFNAPAPTQAESPTAPATK